MRRQGTNYTCAIASIANALEVLGIKRSQREVARLCHVDPEHGTDETEVKRALLANRMQVDEWHDRNAVQSELFARDSIVNGRPLIICVDASEHWLTVVGMCGSRYLLFDPSRNQGIEVHSAESLLTRWCDPDEGFYGIAVALPEPLY